MPNVLLMTGDRPKFGDHPEAKPVFDLDSVQLLYAARMMRDEGRLLSGRSLSTRPGWLIGAVENPFAPPPGSVPRGSRRRPTRARSSCRRRSYSTWLPRGWIAEVGDLGLGERCRILAGVGPVRSLRALDHMRTGVPGLHIPDEVDRRLRRFRPGQVAEEGLRICVEIIEQIREIPGVSGVHVMAPRYEHAIPGILERAGLARRAQGRWPGPGSGCLGWASSRRDARGCQC